ncbi:MAG: hypothetical protein LQ352_001062 [Teloschistes flavicans]|nr:MAG: hypothetical protein LQ352_001062 [Teloschistes flavicans]
MAEFSDRPMTPPPAKDQYYGFFPAHYSTAYLEKYVDDHVYDGHTIRDRILFNSHVDNLQRHEVCNQVHKSLHSSSHWTVTYNTCRSICASKIIDATGMTSQPYTPSLHGSDDFRGRTLHHKFFGQEEEALFQNPSVQNICILGGAKSAADVAYAFAQASGEARKNVHWVIREDGNGPSAFFAAPAMSDRYANSNEGFYNRFLASFLPNTFGRRWSLMKWLMQGTILGRWYATRLWDGFDQGLRSLMNYQREEGMDMGFANLEPDTPIFWQNDSSGVANRPDFLSTLATKVKIYRRDISHVSADSITLQPRGNSLTDGEPLTIPVDVMVYCTGWSTVTTLLPSDQASNLGLSVPLGAAEPHTQKHWHNLEEAADAFVLLRFPSLRRPPAYHKTEPTQTPFRLYKAIAPPADVHSTHSIVFLGKMVVGNNFRTAEVQALWALAYLDGRIKDLPSEGQVEREVAETVAWDRRRYLNKGESGCWFYYDVVDYADALLEQLGLDSHRKGKGWYRDLVDPCFASDLQGLTGEYIKKYMS